LVQRRLGLLLDDDEGAALVAGADAYLRAAGVVDVERYVAMRLPGLELPPRNTSGS
jgi:hypothetical protein